MNTAEVVATSKTDRVARTLNAIAADSKGSLPSRIQLLKTGIWDTPNHGIFAVSDEDLQQYKENFDAGIAQVVGGGVPDGVMIDFDHIPGIAGGWIKSLEVEGDTLWGVVEWTAKGKEELLGGNYKYISPEFYPASRGGWEDPERYGVFIPNVLAAAALVNRPLFKGLKPIMASADGGANRTDVVYVSASAEVKEKSMQLSDLVAKENDALTDAERQFLTENKEQLSDEQKVKFGFEAAATPPEATPPADDPAQKPTEGEEVETTTVTKEEAAVAASIKSGDMIAVKASQFNQMQKDIDAFKLEKITAGVEKHVARGAIKADQAGAWANRIAKDASVEDLLSALPDNQVLAGEQGSSTKASSAVTATAQLNEKVDAAIAASDGKLSRGDATVKVRRENPDLAKEADLEISGKA